MYCGWNLFLCQVVFKILALLCSEVNFGSLIMGFKEYFELFFQISFFPYNKNFKNQQFFETFQIVSHQIEKIDKL